MAATRADSPDRTATIDQILKRVRNEFLEMPGLRLTCAQARRLWHLDATTCDAILRRLVSARFLACDANHQYLHPTDPAKGSMAKAAIDPRRHLHVRSA